MDPHQAPPGSDGEVLARRVSGFDAKVDLPATGTDDGQAQWSQEYIELPNEDRLGVSFSGGGIRSASYCLGALQILQKAGVLEESEYLTAVSGGDYTAVARQVVVAATWGDFDPPVTVPATDPPAPVEPSPAQASFGEVGPFAPNSPLVFAKAAMPQDAPQDTKAFREVDPRFPIHSTADQFFDERTFEAYRALGAHAARGCVRSLNKYRRHTGHARTFPLLPLPAGTCEHET